MHCLLTLGLLRGPRPVAGLLADPERGEEQLLHVDDGRLEQDDGEEGGGGGDGQDAEELLGQQQPAEPRSCLRPRVYQVDDGSEEMIIELQTKVREDLTITETI